MSQRALAKIRRLVRLGQYDMTAHAMEEVAEDNLTILDVESAGFNGRITRIEHDDPRGARYVIEGRADDMLTPVGVVGRLRSIESYLVITVYEVTPLS